MANNYFDPNNLGDGINDINITPFVDVVLVLLVIFMVTAPVMIKESLKVKLPKALSSDISAKDLSMGVAITKEGQLVLSGKIISENDFLIELEKIKKESPQTKFLISADVDSKHGDLIRVIDALKRNELNHFALQIEKIKQ